MGRAAKALRWALAAWPLACTQLCGCRTVLAVVQPPTHVVVTAQFKLPIRVGDWPRLQWVKVNEACVHPEGPYELPHTIEPAIEGMDAAWAHLVPLYRRHPAG